MRRAVPLLVAFALALAGVLGYTALRLDAIHLAYATSAAAEERRQLEEERRQLLVERSLLRSPARVEAIAAELGMSRPDAARLRVVALPEVAP